MRNGVKFSLYRPSTVIIMLLSALLVLLSACGSSGDQTSAPTPTPPASGKSADQLQITVIAKGLQAPWGLAFLPDGRALVSERDSGRLVTIDKSGTVKEVQQLPAEGSGEGGLLGIALSPNYATDGFVYAYYSTAQDNRVVRFRLGQQPEPILTGIPVSSIHNGGRIAFGPDGMLYIGTGDASNRSEAQNLHSLAGKILRITPDGRVPADNPFPNSPVYSYGHRNVQGLAWDARGQLYATEFGQNQFDEVNRIVPGGNYGWPIVEGDNGDSRFIRPVATFRPSEASPSGATFLKNGAIPQWEGNLFVASLRGERLWRLVMNADGSVKEREALLQGEYGRLRTVAQAPDGSLWILTSNRDGRGSPSQDDDRILRIGLANG